MAKIADYIFNPSSDHVAWYTCLRLL